MNLPRSTHYHRTTTKPEALTDAELTSIIEDIQDELPCYGYKTLKLEEVYRAGYETFADVAARLPRYIEQIYNTKRLNSALGYRSPEDFETQLARKAA